jgi:hypothetical protein
MGGPAAESDNRAPTKETPVSNHPRRRRASKRDERSDVCVFCEITQLLHFVRTVTIPGPAFGVSAQDRGYADQLAASMQRDLGALEQVLTSGLTHPRQETP